jgi:hypothetical protein
MLSLILVVLQLAGHWPKKKKRDEYREGEGKTAVRVLGSAVAAAANRCSWQQKQGTHAMAYGASRS